MNFAYKANAPDGSVQTGVVDMENASKVADFLRSKGYRIIYIKETRGGTRRKTDKEKGGFLSKLTSKISIRDLSIFTDQFGTMMNAGLAISRALSVLSKQTTNPRLAGIIYDLAENVKKGNSLSIAIAKYPDVFSPLYISMVRAGEASGNLGDALRKMAVFLQKDYETQHKIKGAMTYPILVLVFSILIVIGLFIFIIPTFEKFLAQLNAPLPLPTKITFMIADNLIKYGWILLVLSIVSYMAFKKWSKTYKGRKTIDTFLLKAPVIGKLTIESAMSRFSSTTATLFSAGIPLTEVLETVKGVIDNVVIAETVNAIIERIKRGEAFSASLGKSGLFTPMVVEMSSVGEESGKLDEMLRKVAEFYDEEVDYMVNNLTAMINPIMMVFVGGIVGGVLISLYLPIFQMAGYVH
jgi:type IV pilus assembly protein PilC